MKNFNKEIEKQYYKSNLYQSIINGLKAKEINLDKLARDDLSVVDEFHVRGAKVSNELANISNIKNSKILDVGCGIGGPCRMLAEEYNCIVTGIDLSKEYAITANKLSNLVRLNNSTSFLQANATILPFKDCSYDLVWTQHVQMNIQNKLNFYSEIERVLIPDGKFIFYDIFKNGHKKTNYPMPWADESNISFLTTIDEVDIIISSLGFTLEYSKDQTKQGVVFLENLLSKIRLKGQSKFGLNLLMGDSTTLKLTNLFNGLKEGNLSLISRVYKN